MLDDVDKCPDTPAGTRVDSVGCVLVVDSATCKLQVSIRFKNNSVIIDSRSYPAAK